MGEERELLMALALNRARVASQRELAIAWWSPPSSRSTGPAATGCARGVRYRLAAAGEIERRRGAVKRNAPGRRVTASHRRGCRARTGGRVEPGTAGAAHRMTVAG